jgi:carbohydrate kinase (thermoresistant glucokinase family)
MSAPRTLILMGVCGCGKTLIGSMLAKRLGGIFEDADDFHSVENKAKMGASIPLTDEDRRPWLRTLRERIVEMRDKTPCYLLACSALKQAYRDVLRGDDSRELLEFVHLKGSRELIGSRMAGRKGHYMPTNLLDSQFAILEEPQDALTVDISGTPDQIARDILQRLT